MSVEIIKWNWTIPVYLHHVPLLTEQTSFCSLCCRNQRHRSLFPVKRFIQSACFHLKCVTMSMFSEWYNLGFDPIPLAKIIKQFKMSGFEVKLIWLWQKGRRVRRQNPARIIYKLIFIHARFNRSPQLILCVCVCVCTRTQNNQLTLNCGLKVAGYSNHWLK